MSLTTAAFLESLKAAAIEADGAEAAFRREIAGRMRELEAERAFSHRRLNFMRALAEAVAAAENQEAAVATALAAVRERLGWSADTEARTAVLSKLAVLAETMYARLAPAECEEQPEIGKLLSEFEDWYKERHREAFWILFEHYIPETPRVDF